MSELAAKLARMRARVDSGNSDGAESPDANSSTSPTHVVDASPRVPDQKSNTSAPAAWQLKKSSYVPSTGSPPSKPAAAPLSPPRFTISGTHKASTDTVPATGSSGSNSTNPPSWAVKKPTNLPPKAATLGEPAVEASHSTVSHPPRPESNASASSASRITAAIASLTVVEETESLPDEDVEAATAMHARVLEKLAKSEPVVTEHVPAGSSAKLADILGVPIATVAKSVLLKANKDLAHGSPWILAVIPANKTPDLKKIGALIECRLTLATPDDVVAHCGGLTSPSSLPPTASLFENVKPYLDRSMRLGNTTFNFPTGSRSHSILDFKITDYTKTERPEVMDCT